MPEHTMATVLFISVFVFLFFKFCLGAGPLGMSPEAEGVNLAGALSPEDRLLLPGLAGFPLTAVYRKCPVGSVYSVAVGGCKDIVRSNTKSLTQRLQVLMPYLVAASERAASDAMPMPR